MDFYDSISDIYNQIFPPNPTQVEYVKDSVANRSEILDIGCGTGNLAISLSELDYRITAIDPNKKMLEIAKRNGVSQNPEFLELGMLEINTKIQNREFDAVLCFGNTVVHLLDLKSIERFFTYVKDVTRPGGKFIFQIINYDNVLDNNLRQLPTIENSSVKFVRNYKLNKDRLIEFETVCTLKDTNETLINTVNLFPLRKSEAEYVLRQAGFDIIQAFSSFRKDPYDPDSLPLIIECS